MKKLKLILVLFLISCEGRVLKDFEYDSKEIKYQSKQITSFPSDIDKYEELEVLNLSFNQIDEIPEDICELEKLTSIYLSENNLVNLPDCICKLNLKQIGLSGNKLTNLPDCFQTLKLNKLYLGGNSFSDLSNELIKVTPDQLEFLDISNSQLIKNTTSINRFSNLKELLIDNCQISSKFNINSLVELEKLSANDNVLSELPYIYHSSKLKLVSLSGNKLQRISDSISILKSIEILDLSRNQIKELPPLKELKKLSKLNLANNQFEEFPAELLELDQLRELNLSFNDIRSIPDDIYKMRNLRVIYLIKCQLSKEDIDKLSKAIPGIDVKN